MLRPIDAVSRCLNGSNVVKHIPHGCMYIILRSHSKVHTNTLASWYDFVKQFSFECESKLLVITCKHMQIWMNDPSPQMHVCNAKEVQESFCYAFVFFALLSFKTAYDAASPPPPFLPPHLANQKRQLWGKRANVNSFERDIYSCTYRPIYRQRLSGTWRFCVWYVLLYLPKPSAVSCCLFFLQATASHDVAQDWPNLPRRWRFRRFHRRSEFVCNPSYRSPGYIAPIHRGVLSKINIHYILCV